MALRRKLLIAGVLVLLVAAGLAAYYYPRYAERREVIGTISRYNVLLSQALAEMDEKVLRSVADPGEVTRIGTYMVLLDGTDTLVESELLDLDVSSYQSAGETFTVLTEERWRYSERDSKTGRIRIEPEIQVHKVKYTVIDTPDGMRVYQSLLKDSDGAEAK